MFISPLKNIMFKMAKVQSGGGDGAGIFRDIGPLQDRFKASRVVSWYLLPLV